jgi:hypothetical protein
MFGIQTKEKIMAINDKKKIDVTFLLFEQLKINNAFLGKISRDLHIIRNKILDKDLNILDWRKEEIKSSIEANQ